MELYTVIERQAKFIGLSQVKHIPSHVFLQARHYKTVFLSNLSALKVFGLFKFQNPMSKSNTKPEFQALILLAKINKTYKQLTKYTHCYWFILDLFKTTNGTQYLSYQYGARLTNIFCFLL
jgi:hypothetical protein